MRVAPTLQTLLFKGEREHEATRRHRERKQRKTTRELRSGERERERKREGERSRCVCMLEDSLTMIFTRSSAEFDSFFAPRYTERHDGLLTLSPGSEWKLSESGI